jgi:hypothetical protein
MQIVNKPTYHAGLLKCSMAAVLFACMGASSAVSATSAADTNTTAAMPKTLSLDGIVWPTATVPQHDLVVVRGNQSDATWVMVTDAKTLGQMIGRAKVMSMIPPSGATFYSKGYPVEWASLPLFLNEKNTKKIIADKEITLLAAKRRQQVFNDDGWAYTEKRTQLQQTPG